MAMKITSIDQVPLNARDWLVTAPFTPTIIELLTSNSPARYEKLKFVLRSLNAAHRECRDARDVEVVVNNTRIVAGLEGPETQTFPQINALIQETREGSRGGA